MRQPALNRSLSKAMVALGAVSEHEIAKLPLAEAALVLHVLPHAPELHQLRTHLAARLYVRATDTNWLLRAQPVVVFAVFTAMWEYDATLLAGEQLAVLIKRLLAAEVAEGGPYTFNGTVSVKVQAQILLFAQTVAKPLPNLVAFLHDAIDHRNLKEPRPEEYILVHTLARTTPGKSLKTYLLERCGDTAWQTPAGIATCLGGLTGTLTVSRKQAMLRALQTAQEPNGFWDDATAHRITTTALVAEILHNERKSSGHKHAQLHMQHEIVQAARKAFASFSSPLNTKALAIIDAIHNADQNHEITMLSEFFITALRQPCSLTSRQRIYLGAANLHAWTAYTIYDELLDDVGTSAQLPIANIAMRNALQCFRLALPDKESIQQYVSGTFNSMDDANMWEIYHCRYTVASGAITVDTIPDYANGDVLARRAFAHALGPIVVLLQCAAPKNRIYNIEQAFCHYLIAKQLSDDLLDWPEDIRHGQISYVVAAILQALHTRPDTYKLDDLLSEMQTAFQRSVIVPICKEVIRHITKSRHTFAATKLLKHENDLYNLLDSIEKNTRSIMEEHKKARAFAEAYKTALELPKT